MKTKNTMFIQNFGDQFSQWLGDAIVVACNRSFAAIEAWRRSCGRRPVEELSTNQVHEAVSAQDSPIVLVDVRGKGSVLIDHRQSIEGISIYRDCFFPSIVENNVVIRLCSLLIAAKLDCCSTWPTQRKKIPTLPK